ncbi:CD276 antigen-like [Astyanax mexicanus]|uniref:CD276 antigen-like n=1 Tax=Astyanax mexicanus TaxID=7994 RepID=A0A8T2M031_ASTMX|nr:CD276 antigen-like [Astyanax mexicanus]
MTHAMTHPFLYYYLTLRIKMLLSMLMHDSHYYTLMSLSPSLSLSSAAEFEITVPSAGQVGVYGRAVVLSCSFPVGSSWDEGSTVITWQRNLEVVHSFYHSRDQLDRQSSHYADRTSLYHEEMSKGNASLRLERVTLKDEGVYTCSVSTQIGSQKKSFRLKVAAFFPEPHLHISLLHNGQVDLLLTSQGGYPSPSLQWLIGNTEDVTEVTQTQLEQDENTKLYSVNSKLNLTRGTNSSITFILKNEDLGQEIRRNIDLFSENEETGGLQARHQLVIFVVLLVVVTSAAVVTFLFRRRKQKNLNKDSTRTTEVLEALNPSKTANGSMIDKSPC